MISNLELLTQVQISQEIGELQSPLALSIIDIVNALATHPNWRGYTYLEDMKQSAILVCCKQWKNFKSELSTNPLAYFIQVTRCSFTRTLNEHRRDSSLMYYTDRL